MKKVLIISPQPFFSPRGTPFSVYYRTLISSELGLDMDLLTYGEGQDVDIKNVNIIRIPRFKRLGNVKLGPSFLKLFLDIFIIFKMISLLIKNKYDVVHAHEEAVFFAWFLKPIFKYKLIYDMHSSLPQQLTNFKFTTSKILIKIFEKLEVKCLHSSEAVITICPDLRDYVNGVISDQSKHFLIENSIFEDIKLKIAPHTPESHEPEGNILDLAALRKEGETLLVYAGTLEKYQGIDILINAMPQVVDQNQKVKLLIVGGTETQVETFKAQAMACGLGEHITFTGRVPQKTAKHYTGNADILLSPRSDGTNTPLKIYEQLASGTPLIATKIYSHTQVLTDKVAFLVEPTPDDMARGINEAIEHKEEARERALKAQDLYEEEYSRSVYTTKLKNLLESL